MNKCVKILDFGATWCGGCKVLKENLKNYDGRIPIEYINCDTDDDIPTKYGVRNLPTLVLLDSEDQILERIVGVRTLQQLYDILDKYELKSE